MALGPHAVWMDVVLPSGWRRLNLALTLRNADEYRVRFVWSGLEERFRIREGG